MEQVQNLLNLQNQKQKRKEEDLRKNNLVRLIKQVKHDWHYNRFRLIMETIAMICAVSYAFIISIYHVNQTFLTIFTILSFEFVGCIAGCIYGYLRNSINIIILNVVLVLVSIIGFIKLFLGS